MILKFHVMNRFVCLSILLTALHLSAGVQSAQIKLQSHTFTLPDGFEVELVAGPPLVNRPISADFDEQGRLYVTDASGSNDKVQKQLEDKPHRIVRLEDTDGDGRFDKSIVFADQMMFPEGAMWFDGSLYVAAPPSIWKLTDTDNDGVADKCEEWFQGKTLTGCANDLHGPYLGPDGWIYWCKGAFAEQEIPRHGQAPTKDKASHIFRARPDGSGRESVMSGGMDNPVEIAFTREGEPIFTCTFITQPAGGQRDALVQALYGGVYGKVNDVLNGLTRTGELLPPMTHLGPAAPSGLCRYASRELDDKFTDNLFSTHFNLHRVQRHELVPTNSTYFTRDTDFLVSDNPDFHPTDVLEDADGSLLVIDTGGWYKLCCPTSQLAKPDVLGGIYRIRRTGAKPVSDPRGLKFPWRDASTAELVKRLDDFRPAVCERTKLELTRRGDAAVRALAEQLKNNRVSANWRLNITHTLTRIGTPAARAVIRSILEDRRSAPPIFALYAAGLLRDTEAVPALLKQAKSHGSFSRAAATALGRIGDKSAVPVLLDRTQSASLAHDRAWEHSLIYALIEIGDREGTLAGWKSRQRSLPASALIALDQVEGGGVSANDVLPLLQKSDPALRLPALWIAGHHPEWGEALAGSFRELLARKFLGDVERAELEKQLVQFARNAAVQTLLANVLHQESTAQESRLTVLRAMAQSGVKETPAAWVSELSQMLITTNTEVLGQIVRTVRALPSPKTGNDELTTALLRVARDAAKPDDVRLNAMAAVPGRFSNVESEMFEFLRANIVPTKSVMLRTTAAGVLTKAKLNDAQLVVLVDSLKTAGPLELSKLLGAFHDSTNEALGLKLISTLKQSAGLSGLRAEVLKPTLTNFPATVQQQGAELLASLNVDAAKQKAHLEELLASASAGDIRRGQGIFNSAKAACSACHAIGYLGGNVGPDLTRIGQVRTERDLLESIVYPSASFVRSFEPMLIVTRSGEEHSGVLRRDNAEEVSLATGPGVEVRVSRADIVEMRPGTVSVMPAGLDEQLTRQELADLLAFLKATRW